MRVKFLLGCTLLLTALTGPFAHAENNPDDAYLDNLLGDWDMTGKMGSIALHYHAVGERVLQKGFLRLHMVDAAAAPKYEADVFIGFDPEHHDYIAHWLDRFGAAGARVVGTGTRNDNVLITQFPYAEGNFRDTFTYAPASRTWTFLLESQKPDGNWSTFASYALTRKHRT